MISVFLLQKVMSYKCATCRFFVIICEIYKQFLCDFFFISSGGYDKATRRIEISLFFTEAEVNT